MGYFDRYLNIENNRHTLVSRNSIMKAKTNNPLRKVIKKDYSHLISLPLFWLQAVGLEASDYVELAMGKDNQLIVKPYKKEKEVEEQ